MSSEAIITIAFLAILILFLYMCCDFTLCIEVINMLISIIIASKFVTKKLTEKIDQENINCTSKYFHSNFWCQIHF